MWSVLKDILPLHHVYFLLHEFLNNKRGTFDPTTRAMTY